MEELSELLDMIEVVNESSLENFPEDLTERLSLLINRIDSLYLRNIKNKFNKDTNEESVEALRHERNLYRTKSVQLARVVERYWSALTKQLEAQQETYDIVGEAARKLTDDIESSDVLKRNNINKHLEELEQIDDELDKMRSNTEEFREKHDLNE